MQFAFTEEQDQFRDIVSRFCRDKSPSTVVRQLMSTDRGYDETVWKQLCHEVGLAGIHIPEDKGGVGFGPVELGIVMEEFGRSLIPVPYFSCCVLACTALAEVPASDVREPLLSQITSGDTLATLALEARRGKPLTSLQCEGDNAAGYTLDGTCGLVLDGQNADIVLAIAKLEHHHGLFKFAADAPGLTIESLQAMDATRKLSRISLKAVAAEKLCELDHHQIDRIYDTALVALANEMVGGAQALLDSAVEYTKLRVQFGRTIGSFQAIKHRLADLLVDVELAKTAAYQAAQALADGEAVASTASLAKFVASDVYMKAALETIQLHGGIGFTWENDTHLWFRRAKSSEVFLGIPAYHRERMLKEMQI